MKPFRLLTISALSALLTPNVQAELLVDLPAEFVSKIPKLSEDASVKDPSIASYRQLTAATWTEYTESSSNVAISVSSLNQSWTPPVSVEWADDVDAFDSDISFSASGNLGVVWVSSEGEKSHLRFMDVSGDTETITTSRVAIETPTLSFIDERPVVAWAEGGAGIFAVIVAEKFEDEWKITPLSESLTPYDILPVILKTEPTSLYWYHLTQNQFVLKRADAQNGFWNEQPVGQLQDLPTQRLPYLFQLSGSNEPGAIWIEPESSGDQIFTYHPESADSFSVHALSPRDSVSQLDPEANGQNELAFAWVEKTKSDSRLVLSVRDTDFAVPKLSNPTQPRLSWSEDRTLQCIAVNQSADATDSALYHIYLPLGSSE